VDGAVAAHGHALMQTRNPVLEELELIWAIWITLLITAFLPDTSIRLARKRQPNPQKNALVASDPIPIAERHAEIPSRDVRVFASSAALQEPSSNFITRRR
jgi:hypothetical protein